MSLHPAKLQKPLRKLRKMLNKIPRKPAPEQVHDLRTLMRRIEAMFRALMIESKRNQKRLLKALKPVRKKTGKVRDMDVLTGFASKLRPDGDEECLVELLEYLGAERYKQARKLHRVVQWNRKAIASRLKRSSEYIEKVLAHSQQHSEKETEWPIDAMSLALQLSNELASWPRLDAGNFHPFRLKVKELRYALQLAKNPDADLIESLGEVKDAIGEWHDWEELTGIAGKVLDHGPGRNLIRMIRSTAKEKFDHALSITNRMRQKYSDQQGRNRRRNLRRPVAPVPKPPVISAASSLLAA